MIAVVTQARMSSLRLPGKVLRHLDGKPALEYHLERLARCEQPDLVVVATSADASDDMVAALCERLGFAVHRGPLENVAGRYLEVVERFGLDAFARVTGDSPLIDQAIVDRAIAIFGGGDFDLVTNVFPSTFASGQSVEVVDAQAFRHAYERMSEPDHFEHVTAFFYRNPDGFRIENFSCERDEGELDVALDSEEDARLIETILARMDRPHVEYGYDEVMALYRQVSAE